MTAVLKTKAATLRRPIRVSAQADLPSLRPKRRRPPRLRRQRLPPRGSRDVFGSLGAVRAAHREGPRRSRAGGARVSKRRKLRGTVPGRGAVRGALVCTLTARKTCRARGSLDMGAAGRGGGSLG